MRAHGHPRLIFVVDAAAALSVLNPGEHGLGLTIRIKNKADKYVSDYDAIVRAIQGSKAGVGAGASRLSLSALNSPG